MIANVPSLAFACNYYCLHHWMILLVDCKGLDQTVNTHADQGPVVQSVVSLTSLLRVISLTVLADSMHNILIFFAEKM